MLVYQRVTHTWSILKPPSKFHHIPRSKMTGNAFGWWTVDINGMFSRPCFGFFRGRFTINKQQDKPKPWPILHVLLVKPMWSTPLKRLSCKFCAPLRTLMSIHYPPSRLAGTRGRWTLWSLQKWWWGTLFLDVSLWQGTGSSKLNPSWHWQPGLQRFIFCWWNPTRWGPLTIYIYVYIHC